MSKMPFIIVESTSASSLGEKVSKAIADGYMPSGRVLAVQLYSGANYIQAMVYAPPLSYIPGLL